jgi:hypothetical protein
MDITLHSSFLSHNDPNASPAFYRDTHGFQVRNYGAAAGAKAALASPAALPLGA